MFGMRKGLKLARAAGVPFAKIFVPSCLRQNLRQELRLRAKVFGFQSSFLAGFLNRGKVDMRGEVLFAGIGQQVIAWVMTKIGAKCALGACGRKDLIVSQAVINREQFSAFQNPGGGTPPVFGGRTGFDGVVVGQNGFQLQIVNRES